VLGSDESMFEDGCGPSEDELYACDYEMRRSIAVELLTQAQAHLGASVDEAASEAAIETLIDHFEIRFEEQGGDDQFVPVMSSELSPIAALTLFRPQWRLNVRREPMVRRVASPRRNPGIRSHRGSRRARARAPGRSDDPEPGPPSGQNEAEPATTSVVLARSPSTPVVSPSSSYALTTTNGSVPPGTALSLTPRGRSECSDVLGELSFATTSLLRGRPQREDERGGWMLALACSGELALHLLCLLGVPVSTLAHDFACVLHLGLCRARLLRLANGETIYADASLSWTGRHWLTLPELAASLASGSPARLAPLASELWFMRLLHTAGLLALPPVGVPLAPEGSPGYVARVREGFELLVRCKWFLYPGQPVSYTRAFVHQWCGVSKPDGRKALDELNRLRIIRKVGETKSGYKQNQTALYLPGLALETGTAT